LSIKINYRKLLVSTVSFEVVPLGTVTNGAKKDYFEGDGKNYELGKQFLMDKFFEFLD
jgi:hypothetical protein